MCESPDHEFISFSARGTELHTGQTVYSRKLNWSVVSGSTIREHYGVPSILKGRPQTLHICKARKDYKCEDCKQRIDKGSYHASATYYDHYCLGCVETIRPEIETKPVESAQNDQQGPFEAPVTR